MKRLMVLLCAALLLIAVGCGKPESPQEQFQNKAKTQIEHMQKKMDELKTKFNEELGSLQKMEDSAKAELEAMKKTTGEAWDKAKDKMSETMDKIEKRYERMQRSFE